MGRKKRKYQKTLHQQAYERLVSMQAFGRPKHEDMRSGLNMDKIYSYSTYKSYWQHIRYFLQWIHKTHPECTTLKSARRHVREWLEYRADEKHLSAWTLQLEAAALNKLFQIDLTDPDRFVSPHRRRADIQRSRVTVKDDRHFSAANNDVLIRFCRGTGCRRNVLQKLEGRDYWTRSQMLDEVQRLSAKEHLSAPDHAHLLALKDALDMFPDQNDFVHHRKDKGGLYRYAPIIGPDHDMIIDRLRQTGAEEKVWLHVHSHADVHAYRADYATSLYTMYARPIKEIPYDRVNTGLGIRYQGDVYHCRGDEKGKRLDKKAMRKCAKALGHNRISVVSEHYLRSL